MRTTPLKRDNTPKAHDQLERSAFRNFWRSRPIHTVQQGAAENPNCTCKECRQCIAREVLKERAAELE